MAAECWYIQFSYIYIYVCVYIYVYMQYSDTYAHDDLVITTLVPSKTATNVGGVLVTCEMLCCALLSVGGHLLDLLSVLTGQERDWQCCIL